MANLFADEDVPYRLQECLRLLGPSVATARQYCENKAGGAWTDEAVPTFAVERRWTVLTFNVDDFQHLAALHPGHFGIILGQREENQRAQARRINQLMGATGD